MIENRVQRIESILAKIFRAGQRAAAVRLQFRQHAPGVPLAIEASGVRQNRQAGYLVAEAQRDVAVVVVAIAVQPVGHSLNLELLAFGRMERGPGHGKRAGRGGRDGQCRYRLQAITIDQFRGQQSHEGQSQQRRPVAEALERQHFENAAQ